VLVEQAVTDGLTRHGDDFALVVEHAPDGPGSSGASAQR
jgi:hypothetical protein